MSTSNRAPRNTLTHARLVEVAMHLADTKGIKALTIRALASQLGVTPMAIYHHVANKDELLDALVEEVYSKIYQPIPGEDWRVQFTRRAQSMRAVLRRHVWAVTLLDFRTTPGEATLSTYEAALDTLRTAGFSLSTTAHAYAIMDAFVYGFVLQEALLEIIDIEQSAIRFMQQKNPIALPRMAEFATEYVLTTGYEFGNSFDVGLELILDGLERLEEGSGGRTEPDS